MTRRRWSTVVGMALVILLGLVAWYWSRRLPLLAGPKVAWSAPLVDRDLEAIRTDTLRVLVMSDPLTWEQRPKAESGLELELLERFAKQQKIPLLAVPVQHMDSMLLWLQEGRGDVMAAQLAPRRDHKRWIRFTRPYRTVRPMLAVLRDDPHAPVQGKGPVVDATVDSVALSPWSPFADPGYRFSSPVNAGRLLRHDSLIAPEDLLLEVVRGAHTATVVSDARAAHARAVFPILEYTGPLGPPQEVCFATRRNARALHAALDQWLEDPDERDARELMIRAYGEELSKPGPLKNVKGVQVVGDSISPYDNYFRTHADNMSWDWELLAAMAWKESRFDSTAISSKGAAGIMQMMPGTAQRFGLDSTDVMDDHIGAAVQYLSKLDTLWRRAIPDRDQRLRFVLASYNAGPGHIIDAQRLAEQLGLDPDRWEGNMERAVLLMAVPRYYMLPGMKNGYCKGSQVFHYVRDIVSMYRQLKSKRLSDKSVSKSSEAGRGAP